jgi:predicted nucleic acid-binding protein
VQNVERIAADANIVLSAAIGGAARRVFNRPGLEIVTTVFTMSEVLEYLPELAESRNIALELLEAQLGLLAVREHNVSEYREFLPEALRRIGKRDPEDVDLLALALALQIPIWTNDRDFQGTGVRCYTTARLLKLLGL